MDSFCGTSASEAGVFKMPRVEQGARAVELRASELAMILDGIDVSKLRSACRATNAPCEAANKKVAKKKHKQRIK